MPERHLTTTAIDCSGLYNTRFEFWRYLGVEEPQWDHAYIRISTDGENWTELWTNTAEVSDNQWVAQSFDIGAIADNQPSVLLRWTMGATDSWVTYCGWNIDDVEILGVEAVESAAAPADPDDISSLRFSTARPNPATENTRLHYLLPREGDVRLRIFDTSGRQVAILVDERQTAGPHDILWQANDITGAAFSSGIFYGRLEFEGEVRNRKLTLIR